MYLWMRRQIQASGGWEPRTTKPTWSPLGEKDTLWPSRGWAQLCFLEVILEERERVSKKRPGIFQCECSECWSRGRGKRRERRKSLLCLQRFRTYALPVKSWPKMRDWFDSCWESIIDGGVDVTDSMIRIFIHSFSFSIQEMCWILTVSKALASWTALVRGWSTGSGKRLQLTRRKTELNTPKERGVEIKKQAK